jgi:hypothetical protein
MRYRKCGLAGLARNDRADRGRRSPGLAILLGLLHGILNGSDLPKTPSSGQISAAGVASALFVVLSWCRPGRTGRLGACPVLGAAGSRWFLAWLATSFFLCLDCDSQFA